MPDDTPAQLYRAFVSQDPAAAIRVIERARSAAGRSDLFDTVFAPALALLGAAWASAEIDETAFAQAAVVAEQISSFVMPSTAPADTGVTVIVGCARRDRHSIMRNIVGAALKDAGNRVVDLGADVRTGEFVEKVQETGARVIILFAEIAGPARRVAELRAALESEGLDDIIVFVCGGPFAADPSIARAGGANGIVRGAESAVRLVAKAASDRLGKERAS